MQAETIWFLPMRAVYNKLLLFWMEEVKCPGLEAARATARGQAEPKYKKMLLDWFGKGKNTKDEQ